MFCETDVLAREVSQKSIFALPCCMGSIFFCHPHPLWEHDFCILRHLPSEKAIFLYFFDTSPARINKINKTALRSYGFDASARKSPKANRQQIVILLRQVRSGRAFQITKNLTNRFKNVCNTEGISTITT